MLVVLLLWARGTPYAYSTGNGLASGGKPKKNKGRFRDEKKILYRSSSAGCAPRRIRGGLAGLGGHAQVERGRETDEADEGDRAAGNPALRFRRERTSPGVLGGIRNRASFEVGRGKKIEQGRETDEADEGDRVAGIPAHRFRRGRTSPGVLGGVRNRVSFDVGQGENLAERRCESPPVDA